MQCVAYNSHSKVGTCQCSEGFVRNDKHDECVTILGRSSFFRLRRSARNFFSQESEITMEVAGWVQVSLGFFLLENRPKIALNQYWYFGVVYHVYSVCTYIAKSCWLLWFECSVNVRDGFPKKVWIGAGGWGELYLFWIFGILICKATNLLAPPIFPSIPMIAFPTDQHQ